MAVLYQKVDPILTIFTMYYTIPLMASGEKDFNFKSMGLLPNALS